MKNLIDPQVAAIRRMPKQPFQDILLTFAQTLEHANIKVHGIVQETIFNSDGIKMGVDALDISTNERIPLLRPTAYETNNKLCSLNLAKLSVATKILRHAIEAPADIAIVERFGKTEAEGGGLADDLLSLMASGVPTIVLVSHDQWDAWEKFSGGLADTLQATSGALMGWWGSIQPKKISRLDTIGE